MRSVGKEPTTLLGYAWSAKMAKRNTQLVRERLMSTPILKTANSQSLYGHDNTIRCALNGLSIRPLETARRVYKGQAEKDEAV